MQGKAEGAQVIVHSHGGVVEGEATSLMLDCLARRRRCDVRWRGADARVWSYQVCEGYGVALQWLAVQAGVKGCYERNHVESSARSRIEHSR